MKNALAVLLLIHFANLLSAQSNAPGESARKAIQTLIDNYSLAREKRDTVLLKNILTADVDQLVSTGEWRTGIKEAVKGMLASSASSPGTRTLTIDRMKMIDDKSAVVDCRYEIQNADGSVRKMWSTFVVVQRGKEWKIGAIRNMLPSR